MLEKEEIEIRSDEVQEILSRVPNWMIRWGITLIFGLILMHVFISWFIKYPDVIQGKITLTTEQPPVKLMSKTGGYIEQLYFKDNTSVKKGQTIAQITNPANKETIDQLNHLLNTFQLKNTEKIMPLLENIGTLGEIQSEFNNLYNSLKEYHEVTHDHYYATSLKNIDLQIEYNDRLALITNEELNLLNKEIDNAKKKFQGDSLLFNKKVISKNEFFTNQSEYANKQQQFINLKRSYVQYKIAAANYSSQKNDLRKNNDDQIRSLTTNIKSGISSIKNYTASWQQNYTVTSPIDGKLSYLAAVTENQQIVAQELLFAVIPDNQGYLGNIQVATQGYGKIAKGQEVKIKLDNYPYQEYGQLTGKLKSIAKIAGKEGYFAQVELTNGLISTYNKELTYTPDMMGTAEIITEDLRLLDRIFNSFRKLLDK